MHTFYIQNIDDTVTLPEVESKHAIKVLRLKTGTTIRLVNGKGLEAFAKIVFNHPKRCEVEIIKKTEENAPPYKIAVAIAPTKSNDRIEWFLEKAIEIGLTDFIPIICTNSERKKFNEARWEKVAISALKQSQRLWIPTIHSPIKIEDFIKEDTKGLKTIAYCGEFEKNEFSTTVNASKNQLILIGPEGDFTPEETQLAFENGFLPVSLGSNRLRTETAGIVACTLMKFA